MALQNKKKSRLISRWVRSQDGETDRLRGTVRVTFHADQKIALIHVPVYPSFSNPPGVQFEESEEFRISVDSAAPWGFRLSVQRQATGSIQHTLIHIWAESAISPPRLDADLPC